jgi:hypothetical protein
VAGGLAFLGALGLAAVPPGPYLPADFALGPEDEEASPENFPGEAPDLLAGFFLFNLPA